MKTFEFWFDFGSTASYLAWTQLPALEAATGARAVLKPMLLGGVFQATGNQSPANIPAKGKYIFIDFARHARRYGVPLIRNPHFPINTLMLMRGAVGMQKADDRRFMDYCHAMFKAIWVEARNMNDPATAADALRDAGFDPQTLLTLANDQATKDALKAVTQEAIDRGVFGAPTFFVGDQMFWGQDRMDFVKAALLAA
jgi:2-hydroxychromene-2-carboxylate isomerase